MPWKAPRKTLWKASWNVNMEWHDVGIVLSSRPYGDHASLVVLLTEERGRHVGLLPGGQSVRRKAEQEPGALVGALWRGRLSEQLGQWSLELERSWAHHVWDDPPRLAALASACILLDLLLADREPHPRLYHASLALFEALPGPAWAEAYVRWEVGLLDEIGFGLDLSRCAVTGRTAEALRTHGGNETLSHVSPRTGRAVSSGSVGPYRDRLLPLPGFLVGQASADGPEPALDGLRLTAFFLESKAFAQRHQPLPEARQRLAALYEKAALVPFVP
jgi:DNA repair protein RecO (recombination protein O)